MTNEGGILFANVHLYAQFLNDYKNVKLINHTTTSNYVFYENPFPLYFGIKLIGSVASLKLNLRLRNNLLVGNTNYNFSNLLFTCFYTDKESYDNLKAALEPVLEIRNNALDLPNIDLTKYTDPFLNQTVKSVELDMRAEKLIFECIDKQNEVLRW